MKYGIGIVWIAFSAFLLQSAVGADLEKAKSFQRNGLLEDAKRELVDVAFSDTVAIADKAEALLILGDIALQQGNHDVARENWARVSIVSPDSPSAVFARERILNAAAPASSAVERGSAMPAAAINSVLIVADQKYPWAAPQLAASLSSPTILFDGRLLDAFSTAKEQQSITGILEISLTTDAAFESGRVVCYRPEGGKVWEEKVMFNLGGGEERIARRFTQNLTKKIKGRKCP